MITLKQYFMGRDKEYPVTTVHTANAVMLLGQVNELLKELGITDPELRSGYRPGHYNVVAGGAPNSAHLTCEAVDVADNSGALSHKITDELLKKHGLYREHPKDTPSWVHLQTRAPKSGRRTFGK